MSCLGLALGIAAFLRAPSNLEPDWSSQALAQPLSFFRFGRSAVQVDRVIAAPRSPGVLPQPAGALRDAPVWELMKVLELENPERIPGAKLLETRQDATGLTVRRIRIKPTMSERLEGVIALRRYLDDTDTFDVLYSGDRVAGIVPIPTRRPHFRGKILRRLFDRSAQIHYFDFSPYLEPIPTIGAPNAEAQWKALAATQAATRIALQTYVGLEYPAAYLTPLQLNQGSYVYAQIDTQTGERALAEITPGGRFNPFAEAVSAPHIIDVVIPLFPTVYSPARYENQSLDDAYYHAIFPGHANRGAPDQKAHVLPGQSALVVGAGSGLELLLISQQTERKVYGLDVNPFAVANARATAKHLNFEVNVQVHDNIADADGRLAFPALTFDRVFWNMPAFGKRYIPSVNTIKDFIYQTWDGDKHGVVLRRFIGALPRILSRHGMAVLWNEAHFKLGNGKDEVLDILRSSLLKVDSLFSPIAHEHSPATVYVLKRQDPPEEVSMDLRDGFLRVVGLNDETTVAALQISEMCGNGWHTRRIRVDEATTPARNSRWLLRRELANTDTFDVVYGNNGRVLAIVPVLVSGDAEEDPRYFDLTPYSVQVPRFGAPGAAYTWMAFQQRYAVDRQIVTEYLKDIDPAHRLPLAGTQSDLKRTPYAYAEVDLKTHEFSLHLFSPLERNPYKDFPSKPGVAQIVFPLLQTVYVPDLGPDLPYYREILRTPPGKRVWVLGPGSGFDVWLTWASGGVGIHASGQNPFEILNTQYVAYLAGFPVTAAVADNVANAKGKSPFPGETFDVIRWSMPYISQKWRLQHHLTDLQHSDYKALVLRRFLRHLERFLTQDGYGEIWSLANRHVVSHFIAHYGLDMSLRHASDRPAMYGVYRITRQAV